MQKPLEPLVLHQHAHLPAQVSSLTAYVSSRCQNALASPPRISFDFPLKSFSALSYFLLSFLCQTGKESSRIFHQEIAVQKSIMGTLEYLSF